MVLPYFIGIFDNWPIVNIYNKHENGFTGAVLGVSPEYENENDSYFVVRGGVETTVICDHMCNNSETC